MNLSNILDGNIMSLDGKTVSLENMLDAREKRLRRQQDFLMKYGQTLICFTMNIPGPVKDFPLAQRSFGEGKKLMLRHLERSDCQVKAYEEFIDCTGYEGYFAVNREAADVKRLAVQVEDANMIGRLFDMDVMGADGAKISREDIGLEQRKCLLCDAPAFGCARSRAHSAEELIRQAVFIMQDYFDGAYADFAAGCASRALLHEVCITPKPGLVDRANTGAHNDMDVFTFLDSAAVLTPYFRDFVRKGMMGAQHTPTEVFRDLRYMGRQAEDAMFCATKGVNTHKGAIFSLGLICAASGYLHAKGCPFHTEILLQICKEMAGEVVEKDFAGVTADTCKTRGEKLYTLYGLTGVRGEAAGGFHSVKCFGLPVLKEYMQKGLGINEAGVVTLLSLIAHVQDTNIIARCGMERQQNVRAQAKDIFERVRQNLQQYSVFLQQMDREFIECNISPGGCADLLAVSLMLYFLEEGL